MTRSARLAATKSSGDYETEPISGATYDDLDPEMIAEYRTKRAERQRRPIAVDDMTMLVRAGAVTEEGIPTVCGLLLFGHEPQAYLPHEWTDRRTLCGHRIARPGRAARILTPGRDRRPACPQLIEAAWQVVWEEMRVAAVVKGTCARREGRVPFVRSA